MPAAQKTKLTLISHSLCPYVQRAAISLAEKNVIFDRTYIDLANKPNWFKSISPLGKVPLLKINSGVQETVIFESAVILEYLEETENHPLHPASPLERARHRSWIEFASAILNTIGGFYNAKTDALLNEKREAIIRQFTHLETELKYHQGPWFSGQEFSMVDAVLGPVFRYFDVFDSIRDFGFFKDQLHLQSWRIALSKRPSVKQAVTADYNDLLTRFLIKRNSALSKMI